MSPDDGNGEPRFDVDEGWFTDPWGRHEARWMSVGRATDLVRDGGTERRDPPPGTPPTVTPTLIDQPMVGAEGLKRADEAEAEFIDAVELRAREMDAAEEGIDSAGPLG